MAQTTTRAARARFSRGRQTATLSPTHVGKWIAGPIALLLLVSIAIALLGQTRATSIPGVQTFSGLSTGHTTSPVAYAQIPPVGGEHSPTWLNCGVYTQPVPNEAAVHSLEHGAVWITYRPDLSAEAVEQLRGLVRGRSHALLSPYEGLPAPIVASAWGVQLQVADAADARLAQFLATYEQGAQTPEPGAACIGGIGTPVSR